MSLSPAPKRIKLESVSPEPESILVVDDVVDEPLEEVEENQCSICLHEIEDRTVVPICSHEFCFECLILWTEQSRRCPLCSQSIGEYVIHNIRSRYDYRKRFLAPLRTSPLPVQPLRRAPQTITVARRRRSAREREWGRQERDELEESDKLDRSIAKRKWVYEHDLYAKHVASNSYTKFRPYPTPAQFSASPDLISRTTTFLRRELRVWDHLDVEFLTTFIISLMKAIDIRSQSAVKLLAEFLDMDAPYQEGGRHVNAEHFAHEVYCYVRSPYKDLFIYDTVVQYETPAGVSPPSETVRNRRWQQEESPRVPRQSSHRRRERRPESRPCSWSPSGRRYADAIHSTAPTREVRDRDCSSLLDGNIKVSSFSHHRDLQHQEASPKSDKDLREAARGEPSRKEEALSFSRKGSRNTSTEPNNPEVRLKARVEHSNSTAIESLAHGTSNESLINGLQEIAPDASSLPESSKRRQPKIQTLQQSVHAHLRSRDRACVPKQEEEVTQPHNTAFSPPVISDLAPHLPANLVARSAHDGTVSSAVEPSSATKMSARNIMARTRARLAREKSEMVVGFSFSTPIMGTHSPPMATNRQHPSSSEPPLIEDRSLTMPSSEVASDSADHAHGTALNHNETPPPPSLAEPNSNARYKGSFNSIARESPQQQRATSTSASAVVSISDLSPFMMMAGGEALPDDDVNHVGSSNDQAIMACRENIYSNPIKSEGIINQPHSFVLGQRTRLLAKLEKERERLLNVSGGGGAADTADVIAMSEARVGTTEKKRRVDSNDDNDDDDGEGEKTTNHGSSGARSPAMLASASSSDRTSPTSDTKSPATPSSNLDLAASTIRQRLRAEVVELEANLRTRAQLRVRLAAEREAGVTPVKGKKANIDAK